MLESLLVSLLGTAGKTDAADYVVTAVFLFLIFALPLTGWWLLVSDFRAYLRALRGALMIVANHLPGLPEWAKQYTPGSLRSLGLEMPCTEPEVKRAYRRLAERLHPDRGGDRRKFLMLQREFEEAITFVREANQAGEIPRKN